MRTQAWVGAVVGGASGIIFSLSITSSWAPPQDMVNIFFYLIAFAGAHVSICYIAQPSRMRYALLNIIVGALIGLLFSYTFNSPNHITLLGSRWYITFFLLILLTLAASFSPVLGILIIFIGWLLGVILYTVYESFPFIGWTVKMLFGTMWSTVLGYLIARHVCRPFKEQEPRFKLKRKIRKYSVLGTVLGFTGSLTYITLICLFNPVEYQIWHRYTFSYFPNALVFLVFVPTFVGKYIGKKMDLASRTHKWYYISMSIAAVSGLLYCYFFVRGFWFWFATSFHVGRLVYPYNINMPFPYGAYSLYGGSREIDIISFYYPGVTFLLSPFVAIFLTRLSKKYTKNIYGAFSSFFVSIFILGLYTMLYCAFTNPFFSGMAPRFCSNIIVDNNFNEDIGIFSDFSPPMIFLPLTFAFMGYEIGRGIALAPVMIIEHRLIGVKSRIKKLQKYLTKREELLTPANALKKEIDRLIGIDPANLRLKADFFRVQASNLRHDQIQKRINEINKKIPRIVQLRDRIKEKLSTLENEIEALRDKLQKIRQKISKLESIDPANVRIKLRKLRSEWEHMTLPQLRKLQTTGELEGLYKEQLLLSFQLKEKTNVIENKDKELDDIKCKMVILTLEKLILELEKMDRNIKRKESHLLEINNELEKLKTERRALEVLLESTRI